MKNLLALLSFVLLLTACSQNIEPIEYGEEACDYCSMTIVDKGHAAQVVTDKGKNYKYDAAECMINYLKAEGNEDKMIHVLVSDYLNPGNMLDAKSATFIISENIPSPMGAFLSAVPSKEDGEKLLSENGGQLFTWDKVKSQIGDAHHMGH